MLNLTTVPVSVCFMVDAITDQGFSLWLQKRSDENEFLNNKWEAPGGKWNIGETPQEACLREIKEETGTVPEKIIFFKDYGWENGDKLINLHTFLGKGKMEGAKGKWFTLTYENPLEELNGKIPPVNHQIINEMSKYIEINKERLWEV